MLLNIYTCMQQLSTIMSPNSILGYSLDTSRQLSKNRPSPSFLGGETAMERDLIVQNEFQVAEAAPFHNANE